MVFFYCHKIIFVLINYFGGNMGEKFKNKSSFLLLVFKSALKGVLVSIILVLIFAFILKFINLNDNVISAIDEVIKIISIFVSVISLVKKSPYKILLKSALVGAVYIFITLLVFSALRGKLVFNFASVIDILLGAVTGIIISIILSVFVKEKVNA